MSEVIDNRVVEMRFDNKNFEKNVQTTMTTLEKLKQKLRFPGSTKAFEDIDKAAGKVNMSGLSKGVEVLQSRFSALEVIGVTALANITNSAVNAGKRMISALTIDPVKTGFQEYETQMGAIQTILANTQKEGTNVEIVNRALDELNYYADKTIYNFTEMARNIGTFTAAGVKLDTSVNAIKGIANLAAVSGSTSQQASTAMYQLSQALAAGKVQLMDWNSVVNAGMGGQVFQDALVRTSEIMQTGAQAAIDKYGSFRESLTKTGWLTADVLTETLNQLAGAYSKADLIGKGYSESQAEEIMKLAQTAEAAATEVKTFTQLWDTLKEAAQSGWGQTWRMVVGDFGQAKERFTKLSDMLGGLIGDSANSRNAFLGGALNSKWDQITEKLKAAGIETETFQSRIKELAQRHNVDLDSMIEKEGSFEKALLSAFSSGKLNKSILSDAIKSLVGRFTEAADSTKAAADQMEKYGEIVNRVIRGDFGNGEVRVKALTEAGYDYATVQNLVNEKLGSSVRLASTLTEEQLKNADSLAELSDEQLRNTGYTDDQIKALRILAEEAENADSSINDLINSFDKPSGSELIWDSFFNVLNSIVGSCKAVKTAWNDAFHPGMTEDEIIKQRSDNLYKLLEGINAFTKKLVVNDDATKNITRSFKGLFALLNIITTVTSGGLKFAFKGLSKLLQAFDVDILDVTANLGDAIVKFRDFVFENEYINKGFDMLASGIRTGVTAIRDWVEAFMALPQVQSRLNSFWNAATDAFNFGRDIVQKLVQDLRDGQKTVGQALSEFAKGIFDYIKSKFGDGVSLKEIKDSAVEVISNFADGVQNGFITVASKIKNGVSAVMDVIGGIDFKPLFAIGALVGIIYVIKKIGDALGILAHPVNVVVGALDGIKDAIKSFSASLKAKAIRDIAVAIAILVGSIVVLTKVDPGKVWASIGALAALALIVGGLTVVVGKFGPKEAGDFGKFSLAVLAISGSLLIMALALKTIASIDPDRAGWAVLGMIGIVTALSTVMIVFGNFVKGKAAKNIDKAGAMLLKMSLAILLLSYVMKQLAGLEAGDIAKGLIAITAFVGLFSVFTRISQFAGKKVDKLGSALLKMSAAMLILILVIKQVSKLSAEQVLKGGLAITAFVGIFAAMTLVTRLAGQNDISQLGSTLIKMSAAMLLMAFVTKIVSKLSPEEVAKGVVVMSLFGLVIAELLLVSRLAGKGGAKIGGTLLAMSASIAILAGVAMLLSMIDVAGLAKGIIAVGMLGGVMALMIVATKGAQDCKGNIIAMSVAIGVMAVAIAALSMIDGERLVTAAASLALVMGAFALIARSTGKSGKSVGALLGMTLVVGALAGILYLLASLPIESAITASASLSLLLLSLSASMLIIGKAGVITPNTVLTMGLMTLVVAGLAAILGVLASMNVGPTLEIAESLSLLILALSGACLVLSAVGATGPAAFVGVGALVTLIAAVGGLMVGIGALAENFPQMENFLDKGLPILEKIGYGLGSFFGNIIGGFTAGVTSGLPEIGANLSDFMTNAEGFIEGAKGVDSTAVDGIGSLASMMAIISGASILEAIASWVTGAPSMDTFATQLESFGEAIVAFSNKVSGNIDGKSVSAASRAGKMMSVMAATIPGTGGVVQWFTGEKDFTAFSEQLIAFGDAIVSFSKTVSAEGAVNEDAVTKAANAGKIMAELQSSLEPIDGVVQWFMGKKDLSSFGEQLEAFGTSIVNFSKSVSGDEKIDTDAITAAATAGEIMTSLQSSLEPMDGVVQWFAGIKDLSSFGEQLEAFGTSIVNFSKSVSGEGKIDTDAVTAAANIGAIMTSLQSSINPTGGVIELFTGTTDFTEFGVQIEHFGTSLVAFSKSVSDTDWSSSDAAISIANQLVTFTESITDLDTSGIDDFEDIEDIGSAMKDYGKQVKDIDADLIASSITSASRLKALVNGLIGLDTSGIANFKVDSIGAAIRDYSIAVSGINAVAVANSIANAESLKSFINSLSGMNTSGVDSFKTAVASLGQVQMSDFAESFGKSASSLSSVGSTMADSIAKGFSSKKSALTSSASSLISEIIKTIVSNTSKFRTAGVSLMTYFIQGIGSKASSVKAAVTSSISSAIDNLRDYYGEFYNAGAYLVMGFAQGITSNTFKAAARARAMALAASEAAKKALDEHSPSKVGYEIGDFFGIAFVNAISDYVPKAYKAGDKMASSARSGLTNALRRIGELVDGKIDMQPTIRPVLDLSNVTSGVGTLNGLFAHSQSIGLARMSDLNVSMNQRNQNGDMDDVVSAISRLRKDLGNISKPSYTINGVTYDDGSNVSDAVKSLIRATRIERRV